MESKFQTSFIPKKPIEGGNSTRSRRRPVGLLSLIAIIIFLLSLAVWGGLFLWKSYLSSAIEKDKQSLEASEKEFDIGTVTKLTDLNNRLEAAQGIISKHVALSKLFSELEAITIKNVRFNDFALVYAGAEKGLTLTMKGQAISYGAVAKQSDYFSQDQNLQTPIFSNLDLDQNGRIIFTVATSFDPKTFLYSAIDPNINTSTSTSATPDNNFAPPAVTF